MSFWSDFRKISRPVTLLGSCLSDRDCCGVCYWLQWQTLSIVMPAETLTALPLHIRRLICHTHMLDGSFLSQDVFFLFFHYWLFSMMSKSLSPLLISVLFYLIHDLHGLLVIWIWIWMISGTLCFWFWIFSVIFKSNPFQWPFGNLTR